MQSIIQNTTIACLKLEIDQGKLYRIHFIEEQPTTKTNDIHCNKIINALLRYFEDPHSSLDIPIVQNGTRFQQQVWFALTQIPVGKTKTYGELAKELNTSPRAIGNACRKNPTPIFVPCHRIVSQQGLGGYAGATDGKLFQIKMGLLAHEGSV